MITKLGASVLAGVATTEILAPVKFGSEALITDHTPFGAGNASYESHLAEACPDESNFGPCVVDQLGADRLNNYVGAPVTEELLLRTTPSILADSISAEEGVNPLQNAVRGNSEENPFTRRNFLLYLSSAFVF